MDSALSCERLMSVASVRFCNFELSDFTMSVSAPIVASVSIIFRFVSEMDKFLNAPDMQIRSCMSSVRPSREMSASSAPGSANDSRHFSNKN